MILDVTGTELLPGNWGKDCPGDGMHYDANGDRIECCCDECDYLLCCITAPKELDCRNCTEENCLRNVKNS